MAETATATAPVADTTQQTTRPQKPDEDAFNKNLTTAEKAHKASMDKLSAIKAKIDLALPKKDSESPTQKRRKELISQANEIRNKQGAGKNTRTTKLDEIKKIDEQVKSRIAEQKAAKAKIPYKNLDELDRQIASLDKQVDSGTMRLVDEKKALSELSNLRKQRKNFGQFEDSQRQIDDLRLKIKEIKDTMDDPESKAMSAEYSKIQAELDAIKAEQDEAFKGINSLRDERTKLQAEQQEKWTDIRKLKDDYYGQKKAFAAFDRENREKQRERRKVEHEKYVSDRKKADAEKVLAEASDPAYMEEIRRANSLLLFLDPEHKVEKGPLMADSGMGAQAQRTVDDSTLKGTKILSKKDREEDFFAAAPKKGGKKGKKSGTTAKNFSCPPSVVEDCSFLNIDPPMSQEDVPGVTEKVRAKLDHWKNDQEAQTQRNIEKAKKKLDEFEKAEATGTNGTEEITEGVKETTIADKES